MDKKSLEVNGCGLYIEFYSFQTRGQQVSRKQKGCWRKYELVRGRDGSALPLAGTMLGGSTGV